MFLIFKPEHICIELFLFQLIALVVIGVRTRLVCIAVVVGEEVCLRSRVIDGAALLITSLL